ncbi:ABC transporter substrate-binding protein [Siccirubricoccus sp. KC 17139]|uniref:ABC transporter substrate-binding protein n=1 Tax=Siccirubricoccus soli TaxID=2899147 RepID=A0ABT1D5R7_9PROT|nr:ABC transporter substrate-binding protein [Siccirubricoccus soli]MCO6417267.1 ABC transporter substrate-binding protein [Siccirubricoccus soli]MCP2683402.1 ABC transporter substrate-binding protein [Siccirubricoccus soli]
MAFTDATRRGLLRAGASLPLSAALIRESRAQAGGTLTVALPTTPTSCDPVNPPDHDWMIVTQNIFENLVEYDIDGVLRPQLAKALPTVSEDGLTYAFELHEGIKFHNGQPLTSEDVKYSFEWMLDPANKAARGPTFNRLSHVEVDSPTKLRVILKEPFSPWLTMLTKFMGIWPKGSREQYGPDHFRRHPTGVGTGPGLFEEWKPNDYISFRRNPNYWQPGKPAWERLIIKQVPEDTSRVAYLLSSQADIISVPPPRDYARLKTRRGIQGNARATLGGWSFIALNNARPPFDDVNFRRAIAHAIDRKTINERIYHGMVETTAVPAPRSSWWFNPAADAVLDYNLDKARDYLKKSKYPNGASFELACASVPYLLDSRDAAIFLQSELAKIGVEVKIRLAEQSVLSPMLSRGELDALVANFMSPGDPTYMIMVYLTAGQFMSKSSSFTDARLDELMKLAFRENEQEPMKPHLHEMQMLLAEKSPFIWLGFFSAANLWRDRVKNFKVSTGQTVMVRDVSLG